MIGGGTSNNNRNNSSFQQSSRLSPFRTNQTQKPISNNQTNQLNLPQAKFQKQVAISKPPPATKFKQCSTSAQCTRGNNTDQLKCTVPYRYSYQTLAFLGYPWLSVRRKDKLRTAWYQHEQGKERKKKPFPLAGFPGREMFLKSCSLFDTPTLITITYDLKAFHCVIL